jgi:hypothetical protein
VGGAVALVVVGGVLGVTGAFGHPVEQVTVPVDSILMPPTVQAESCPGGPVVASVERGSRVVAIARSADGAQVQVRNPGDVSQLVWVSTAQVDADSGQVGVSDLPIGPACPTLYVAQPTVVTPVTPVTPVKPVKPGAPKDTTKPSVGKPTFPLAPESCRVTIDTTASDNVGVTSVTISWSGPHNHGSNKKMTATGGHWEYVLNGTTATMFSESDTFSVTAHDAAGNSSPTNSASTFVQCFG